MPRWRWCAWTGYSKAVLCRLAFTVHALLSIWRAAVLLHNDLYWLLSLAFLGLLLEFIVTMALRQGREWNWFSPSTFLYLVAIVPSLWLQKLYHTGHISHSNNTNASIFAHRLQPVVSVQMSGLKWQQFLEQTMLVVILLARWLQPKGDITRSALSQILLVHLSLAADIIDFASNFSDDEAAASPCSNDQLQEIHVWLIFLLQMLSGTEATKSPAFTYLMLTVWTLSLLQFTLILSRTTEETPDIEMKVKPGPQPKEEEATSPTSSPLRVEDSQEMAEETGAGGGDVIASFADGADATPQSVCDLELMSILLTCLVQDGPFLIIRIVAMAHFNVFNYTIVFFVCKNSLVLSLNLYRVISLFLEAHDRRKSQDVRPSVVDSPAIERY